MRYRSIALIGVLAVGIGVVSLSPARVAGQAASLRTPWGEPDLQGIWNGQTLTPVERPARFAGKPVLTEEEADRLEEEVASRAGRETRGTPNSEADVAGAYNAVFQGGAERLTGRRTSLIIDPPDGRIPPYTPEAQQRLDADRKLREDMVQGTSGGRPGPPIRRDEFPGGYNTNKLNRADHPEDRALGERCMGGNLPDFRMFYQLVQSPGYLAIYHDTGQGQGFNRVIRVGDSPHLPERVRQWWGDARARWEGDTLVVDTTNFTHKTNARGSRENLHLVERFTRVDANTLNYELTVSDPTTWTAPWTLAYDWTKLSDRENPIYEPTCHMGNYGLVGILSGRRAQEAAFAEGRGTDPLLMDIYTGGGEFAGGGIETEGDGIIPQ